MKAKKSFLRLLSLFFVLVTFVGCIPEEITPEFVESDIYGTWQSGTEFYKYNADYTGVTWNENDDMSEAEGQLFTWEIQGVDMTHIHIMEMGASIPKTYVIDELTPEVLKYHDTFKHYTFYKTY